VNASPPPPSALNLPNLITLGRIIACPLVLVLAFSPDPGKLFAAFLIFLAAALSDLWDGYLARKHGWITNLGKLLDPLADKLLLVATFIPFLIISRGPDPLGAIPWWGSLPIWVVVVVFGRELLVTLLRGWAAKRGSVIPSGASGKIKAFIQNIFSGSLLLWYALVRGVEAKGWSEAPLWTGWAAFHGAVTALTLAVAILLTLYSLAVYIREYRGVFRTSSR
jgi:CDP-diacylglycerol---glycerol-3-phosphate 3-phosphatidyltransferase